MISFIFQLINSECITMHENIVYIETTDKMATLIRTFSFLYANADASGSYIIPANDFFFVEASGRKAKKVFLKLFCDTIFFDWQWKKQHGKCVHSYIL